MKTILATVLHEAHILRRGMGDVRCPTERFRSAFPFQIIASELRPAARRDPTERRAAPLEGEQAVSLFQDRNAFAGEMDADLFVEAVTGFFIDFHSLTSCFWVKK